MYFLIYMNIKIRKAVADDANAFINIRHSYRKETEGCNRQTDESFISLGLNDYIACIEHCSTLVLEDRDSGIVIGYSIVIPNHIFRNTKFWQNRNNINWNNFNPNDYAHTKLCYYYQLVMQNTAIAQQYKGILAITNLIDVFNSDHNGMFSSIITYPYKNTSSKFFLEKVEAKVVGEQKIIEEECEFHTDVYFIEKLNFFNNLHSEKFIKRFLEIQDIVLKIREY